MNLGKPENTFAEVFIRPWCGFIIRLIQKDKIEENRVKGDSIFTRMRMVNAAFFPENGALVSWESLGETLLL